MARRHRMSGRGSRRHFTKNAMRVHHKNVHTHFMRGGIRL